MRMAHYCQREQQRTHNGVCSPAMASLFLLCAVLPFTCVRANRPKFLSVLNDAFHRMNIPQADLVNLATAYGTGPMDRNAGGFLEVKWMVFVRDVMALQPASRWNTPAATPQDTPRQEQYEVGQGDRLMAAKVHQQQSRAM